MVTFQLLAEETIEAGLKRILMELLAESRQLLLEPGEERDTAVHNARKNGKRLRAVLRLIRPVLGEESYQRENIAIRDASRHLAAMRDTAVLIETLDLLNQQFELPTETFATARAQLVADYEATQASFWADTAVIPTVVAVLDELHGRVPTLFTLNADDFTPLAGGLLRVYQRGQLHMSRAYQQTGTPEEFHEWRKQVKYLWHQVELLEAGWPAVMIATAEALHTLSGYLGEAHDLAVLVETIHEDHEEPDKFGTAVEVDQLTQLATQLMHQLEQNARPLGHRLYVETPKSFITRVGAYWQGVRE